jgi:hypothetical protein
VIEAGLLLPKSALYRDWKSIPSPGPIPPGVIFAILDSAGEVRARVYQSERINPPSMRKLWPVM